MANTTETFPVTTRVQSLRLSALRTDYSYQRRLAEKDWKKIAEDFRPAAAVGILIGRRRRDACYIVDGQRRVKAARSHGIEFFDCNVFESTGAQQEAEVFKIVNKNRKNLKPIELFHASLKAKDPIVKDVHALVNAYGFKIPSCYGATAGKADEEASVTLMCVNTLMQSYRSGGAPALEFILTVLHNCWPTDKEKVNNRIVAGLYSFWANFPGPWGIDMDKLKDRLNASEPKTIMYRARQLKGDLASAVGKEILRLYARRTGRPKKG